MRCSVYGFELFCFDYMQLSMPLEEVPVNLFVCGKIHPTYFLFLLKAFYNAVSVSSWQMLVEGWTF